MPFLRPSAARGAFVPGLSGTLANAFQSLENAHGPFNPIGALPPMGRGRPSAPVGGYGQGQPGSCIATKNAPPSGTGSTDEASQNCMDDCQLFGNKGGTKTGGTAGAKTGLGDCGCDGVCKRPQQPGQ